MNDLLKNTNSFTKENITLIESLTIHNVSLAEVPKTATES